jgi:uncharacterized protein YndB with AHSA1/START domain
MTFDIKLSAVVTATPRKVYDAWLDSRGHGAMTGGKAKQSARLGARVTAWDGYIWGENLELIPGKRIVQSWRTRQFTKAQRDSKITVTLTPLKSGTRVKLVHSGVPDGETHYQDGWRTHYLEPMQRYFAAQTKRAAKKKKTAKAGRNAKK